MNDVIELPTFEESPSDYDELESRLKVFFKKHLYYPLLKELNLSRTTIQNAKKDPLTDALFSQQVIYGNGRFSGKFSADISKQLRAMGAKFDRKTSSYKLPSNEIPMEVRQVISASEYHFDQKMRKMDQKLASIIPEEITAQFKCADLFDKALWKADRSFKKNIKKITVVPELTKEQREKISRDWQENMKVYINDWTVDQIKEIRKKVFEQITQGKGRESLIPPILKITKTIQESHDEAVNKAKFLAHQESRLLMAKFKEMKYTDAGIHEYIWRCVHRPHDPTPNVHTLGNVRYSHGQLNGKIFRFDDPPISTNPGQAERRNNPGQDYRCRCFARPILRKTIS